MSWKNYGQISMREVGQGWYLCAIEWPKGTGYEYQSTIEYFGEQIASSDLRGEIYISCRYPTREKAQIEAEKLFVEWTTAQYSLAIKKFSTKGDRNARTYKRIIAGPSR